MFRAIVIAFALMASAAQAQTVAYFDLPAELNGTLSISGSVSGYLLFDGEGAAQGTGAIVSAETRVQYLNYTATYTNLTVQDLARVHVPLRAEIHQVQRAAAVNLEFGRHSALYFEASASDIVVNGGRAIIAPQYTSGYASLARERAGEPQLARARSPTNDSVLIRVDVGTGSLELTGITFLEWYGVLARCRESCPPGGGARPTAGDTAVSYSYIGSSREGDVAVVQVRNAVLLLASPNVGIELVGGARLPEGRLDVPCATCNWDADRTLSLRGNLSLSEMEYLSSRSMKAQVEAQLTEVRLDEERVNPSLLGLATDSAAVVGVAAAATGIVLLAKLAIAALFTRRLRDPLEHERRKAIYAYVCAHPGATFREVAREVGLAGGTARHHLTVLKRAGLVVEHPYRSSVRFFENHGKYAKTWRETTVLRDPALAVLETWIRENPDRPQKDVLDAMAQHAWSRSTTQHRLGRLVAEGLAHVVPRGRLLHYRPGPKPTVAVKAEPPPSGDLPAWAVRALAAQPEPAAT
jgi:DNA-binding transcriptional ArsR family regulator